MNNTRAHAFHLFPQLPTELRLGIWRKCLPTRVVELDILWDEGDYLILNSSPYTCTFRKTTDINRRPPVITRVCLESRQVALETGHYRDGGSPPPHAQWKHHLRLGKSWIDPSRDSVHLNWTPGSERQFESDGSALDYLACNAAQARGGSFMFDYLDGSFDGDVNMEDSVGAVQQLRHGPVRAIVMRVIVVHSTHENAAKTGLFGLLGDAPIQLVDISDESRLDAFFDFAKKCESDPKGWITKVQNYQRDSSESVEIALKDQLADTFGAEAAQTLPPLRPVIMFRLCPDWCNHSLGYAQRAQDNAKNDPGKRERGFLRTGIREDSRIFAQSFRTR